jgi:3-deoxy-D-manno-octulosonic-acid transferase
LCLGQTDTDAERLRQLGAPAVAAPGNLKFAAPPLPVDAAELTALSNTINGRPRWLAASTHAGEEAIVAGVHRVLKARFPGLLTVIAPRHPARGPALAGELGGGGLNVAQRSAGAPVAADSDILLADTMGELGLFMRLAPIVFMGKSLAGGGGQNPLEPARLGASILFGPMMENFDQVASRLEAAKAAHLVTDQAMLTEAVAARLADPALVAEEGARARALAAAEAGVLDAVLARIEPWLGSEARPS